MKESEKPDERRESNLKWIVRFIQSGIWKCQKSPKVTLTVDRRLLILFWVVTIFGGIKLVTDFQGLDVTVDMDTFESSRWPHAAGRVRLRSYDWWGLRRAEYIAEPQTYVEDDDSDKTKQRRWMIVNGTGPRLDRWGQQRFPRLLFMYGYVGHYDDFQTYMTVFDEDLRWFDFQSIQADSPRTNLGATPNKASTSRSQ